MTNKWDDKIDGIFVRTVFRLINGVFDVYLDFQISTAPGIATHFEPKFIHISDDILKKLKEQYKGGDFESDDLPDFLEEYIKPRRNVIFEQYKSSNADYLNNLKIKFQ
ncbi:MAG: hypothetical protein IPI31_17865 [Bacteroidetes bacterium]|nr:hypothetical protein [Bacteroidota bacterium]